MCITKSVVSGSFLLKQTKTRLKNVCYNVENKQNLNICSNFNRDTNNVYT